MKRPKLILTNFFLTAEDRSILAVVAEQDGDNGMSSAARRLIREEGRRRGLLPTPAPVTSDAQPAAQAGD